ncbi:MAG: 2Fe-2S iron-sulfur cluster binding domain-containing protein [Moorea sp. SIO2B7]|nr:2Fe-2S iron-sulfur cluster binding domain-containing protein [Moorena sp. SIO2B7]
MFATKDANKTYNVTLINKEKGLNSTIQVRGDEYIHDAAVQNGVQIPISCCAGACVSCSAKLLEGKVDQDHIFLKRNEEEAGFILTCKSVPLSDCVILTHQEDALLDL